MLNPCTKSGKQKQVGVKPLHPPGTVDEFKASSLHCCSSLIRQCFNTSELTSFNLLSAHLC